MAEYVTEQKKILQRILEENKDRAYTVDELVCIMKDSYGNDAPGKSTVYRLMTHLSEEGKVKKFARPDTRKAAYQIIIGEHCDCHLHLKCLDCGKLLHLDEEISDKVLCAVMSNSDFSVSEEATVLFGKCGSCKKQKNGEPL